MPRTLAATVIVGEVSYLAGTVPPDDVAAQITNPAAWGAEPTPVEAHAPPAKIADEYIGADDAGTPTLPERPRSRRSQS